MKHLDTYSAMVPTAAEDPNWANYNFTNLKGTNNRVQVDFIAGSNLVSVSTDTRGCSDSRARIIFWRRRRK